MYAELMNHISDFAYADKKSYVYIMNL